MISIRDELSVIIQRVKDALPMRAINSVSSPSSTVASSPGMDFDSPFVSFNGETRDTFTYGLSTYGGEDVLVKPARSRFVNKEYLIIRT